MEQSLSEGYIDEFLAFIKVNSKSKNLHDKMMSFKLKLCKKHSVKKIPTDIEILLTADDKQYSFLKKYLVTKPGRTIAGVAPIAIMTSPAECPHGKCIMCPGGVKSFFGDVPQSYTGKEPATRRAIRNNYDPYLQVFNRLEQYIVLGHLPQKVELIIMGGTFPARQRKYQEDFVTFAFKAMNDFSSMFFVKGKLDLAKFKKFFMLPGDIDDEARRKKVLAKIFAFKKKGKKNLVGEQEKNEKAMIRCIGLTIETRPDYATISDCNQMLKLGCTRVELGVQSVDDKVLKKIERGHDVLDVVSATSRLKDLGFKINYHVMPGLPGVSLKQDSKNMETLFTNHFLRPDMLKIYPAMVMPGTKLEKMFKQGKFKPISTKDAVKLISKFKTIVPRYVRIMRVQRDIPTQQTIAGVDKTNLRQYIQQYMKEHKMECNCIRCREIKELVPVNPLMVKISVMHYEASGGSEFFITAEYGEKLLGYCRLRFPSEFLRKEITLDSALLRELHVVGGLAEIGNSEKGLSAQHLGIGRMLMDAAEQTASTYYKRKMVVISGIGAKEYYKKLGYKKEGVYMVKKV